MKTARKYLSALLVACAITACSDKPRNQAVQPCEEDGKLVVCFASKGEFEPLERTTEGINKITALAHKYGVPVTYYIKPFTADKYKNELKHWHQKYGDEVGWFSESLTLENAPAELKKLQGIVDWQIIRSTGNIKYGAEWVNMYLKNGIESVWGRCYEQTFTDDITDRGCPYGFYYASPKCYKVPNNTSGGIISVPWLSNDLNLIFRTAQQSTFTFDVNDPQDIGVVTPEDASFWRAEINEYKKQTKYNKIVPLVILQELEEFALSEPGYEERRESAYAILENLFKVLQEEGIQVVTVSEAVDMYKAAYPDKTPPTYAIFDNIGDLPIIKNNKSLELSDQRFTNGKGPSFNGYYATDREDRTWYYYHPGGVPFYDLGKIFTYYDVNGLLVFEEGNSDPIRITPYTNLPENLFGEAILPEMSYWFDTHKYIPDSEINKIEHKNGFSLNIKAKAQNSDIFTGVYLPYGVMLWGDYSAYEIPENAPVGTKILSTDGLYIPMLLNAGENELKLDFRKI